MKRILSYSAVIIGLGLSAPTALAQTTANGPYYATPSWDQQLSASTRFIVLLNWNSEAVLDRETGLVWEKTPASIVDIRNWGDAQDTCNRKNIGNRFGWRLPTIQELATLLDGSLSPPLLPAGHPFINVFFNGSAYWSATTNVSAPSGAWVLLPFAGSPFLSSPKSSAHNYWCVRGGQGVQSE